MESLRARMILHRAKYDLSQAGLADLCGLSKMTVNQIENGNQEPTELTRAKIELIIGGEKND